MKKNKVIVLSLIIFGILFVGIGSLLLLNSNDKNNNNNDSKNNTSNAENIEIPPKSKDSITYKEYKIDNQAFLLLKNEDEKEFYTTIIIDYLNSNNEIINTNYLYLFNFLPQKEVVVKIPEIEEEYNKYNIGIDANEELIHKSRYNDIEVIDENKKEMQEISLTVVNKSNEPITYISTGVLFYKGEEFVGYEEQALYNVEANSSTSLEILYTKKVGEHYSLIDFDNYKVVINDAYSVIEDKMIAN